MYTRAKPQFLLYERGCSLHEHIIMMNMNVSNNIIQGRHLSYFENSNYLARCGFVVSKNELSVGRFSSLNSLIATIEETLP